MITKQKALENITESCLKELYSFAQPPIEWESFVEENKVYNATEDIWEQYISYYKNRENNPDQWDRVKKEHPNWDETKSLKEIIGPAPYEFYYLPKEIMKDICDSYIDTYKLDDQQNLLDIIEILKQYCKDPIVKKANSRGYREYEHSDSLKEQLYNLIPDSGFDKSSIAESVQNKFFEFLDMAGKFYNWNSDLNAFNMNVYLGASPNSNKEAVIENWKKYRNQDIEINEEQIKKEYYGDDE